MTAYPELPWQCTNRLCYPESSSIELFVQGEPEVPAGHRHQDWCLRSQDPRHHQWQIFRQVIFFTYSDVLWWTNIIDRRWFLILIFFPDCSKLLFLHNPTTDIFRVKAEKSAKKDGDIFDAKKEGYKPSEQRKTDQTAIDTQVDD